MGVWAPDLHTYSPYKAASQFALFAAVFAGVAATVYKFYPDKVAVSSVSVDEMSNVSM